MHLDRRGPQRHVVAPWWLFAVLGTITAALLLLSLRSQLYDTNFYSTWEATNLLAGDHPYRDFFEWGIPLQAVVSAAAQWLVGYRIVGEFAVQWAFIIAGILIALHLGVRVSGSRVAPLVPMALALMLLPRMPTFHYPKVFFYPLGVWLAWRYLDRPGRRRAAWLGLATGLAFLFRHDHGVYLGGLAVATVVVGLFADPRLRALRPLLRDTAAFVVAASVVVAPWLVLVQANEGLPAYVRSRAELYELWSAGDSPYRALRRFNPVRLVRDGVVPAPKEGVVSLKWGSRFQPADIAGLERRFGLRLIEGPDANGHYRYHAANVFDPDLWNLRGEIENADSETEGIDWRVIERSRLPALLPSNDTALTWLEQMALLLPFAMIVMAGGDWARERWHRRPAPAHAPLLILAAVFLAAIDSRLFREPSYFIVVTPLTAALTAPLLRRAVERPGPHVVSKVVRTLLRVIVIVFFLLTTLAAVAYSRSSDLFTPISAARQIRPAWRILMNQPPIEGTISSADLQRYTRQAWSEGESRGDVLLRYVHDCTREGDRVAVVGSTPYQVGYLVGRPVAGGQVFWRYGWRADPAREQEALDLWQRQSVPFVLSTHGAVLEEFARYPKIREHLQLHYVPLDGSQGRLLLERRRTPTGTFAALGFPCFR